MKLTTIILTKNSEKLLSDVLESVKFSDEVVIIDSGSTDRTVTIARKYKTNIFVHDFHSFADQRNFAVKKANGEWILFIDADEIVSNSLKTEIKTIVQKPSECVAFKIKRINYFFGRVKWPDIEYLERLFLKKYFDTWTGDVHETPRFRGSVGKIESELYHYTHTDFESMVRKTNQYSSYEATLLFKSNHPIMVPWRFLRIMITKFVDSYIGKGGWKIGSAGFVESVYQSFSYFIVYAKLWEKQLKK